MSTAIAKKEEKRNGKIVAHHPYSFFHRLQSEMNKLFEDATHGWGFNAPMLGEAEFSYTAKVDVKDTGKEIVVTAEVPGVEMEDLEITATKHYLSIAGEKKEEKSEVYEKGCYQMEREYGFFRRVVPLPCEIQNDHVDAVFKNGVLTVTLPKTKEAMEEQKKVTVKAG